MPEQITQLNNRVTELENKFNSLQSYDTIPYETFRAIEKRFPRLLFGSVVWDIGSTSAGGTTSTTVMVTGASPGDPVILGMNAAANGGRLFLAAVTAQDTVSIFYTNTSGSSVDPASDTFYVAVVKKPL